MRRVLIVIGVVVLATAGLVWWLTRDPELPTDPTATTEPDRTLDDKPFAFSTPEDDEDFDAGVGHVSGRVVKEDGTPVPGARVRVFGSEPELERLECGVCKLPVTDCGDPSTVRRMLQGVRDGTIHPGVAVAEMTSGADGTFAFDNVPLGGVVYVTASFFSAEQSLDTEPMEVTVTPATVGTVTATDAEGKALAGVTVTVYSPFDGTLSVHQTDAEGHAALEGLDPRAYVFAEKEGSLPVGQHFMEDLQFVLAPPRTLVIHTHLGTELVDADITIDLHHEERTLRTKGGVLRLEQLPQGFYTVGATSAALAAASQSVELVEPVTELDFQLRRGSKLLVSVLSPTGEPLEQVSGSISGADGDANGDAEQGALLILGPVPEGEYNLSVSSEGMVPINRTIDLKPGETNLELTMRAAPKLTGKVLNGEGKPVAQARVGAFEGDQEIAIAISSDEGEFELEFQYQGRFELRAEEARAGVGKLEVAVPSAPVTLKLESKGVLEVEIIDIDGKQLPNDLMVRSLKDQSAHWVEDQSNSGEPGRLAGLETGKYLLEKNLPERMPIEATVEITEGKTTRLTLHANAGVTVGGKVVDHLGKPVVQASVILTTRAEVVQTDEQGHFLIKGVPPGPGEIFATHPTGAESNKVKITAPTQEVVLTVPEIARVKGRAVDEKGAAVKSFEANGEKVETDDGRFEVAAPNKSLDLWAEGYVSVFMTTAEGDVGDVVLKKEPTVEGDVVDAEGKPVGGASVAGSLDSAPVVTDANGRFKLVITDENPQELIATRGSMSGRAPLKLGTLNHLVMGRGTTVIGKVVDATGKPVPTYVTATSRNTQRPMEIDTDETGHFQLELSQGVWIFSTRSNRAGRSIDVKGDRMEITLGETPGSCSAVVRSTKPIDGIWFLTTSVSEDEGPWEMVSRNAGSIEVPVTSPALEISVRGIPCGHYTVAGSVENIITSTSADLRGAGQVIELVPSVVSDGSDTAGPPVETTAPPE